MPKRPRQAHIPQQRPRTKPRRTATPYGTAQPVLDDEAVDGEAPVFTPSTAPSAVRARPRRRLELITQAREGAITVQPGQLPTYERAFLIRELRQIGITAGILLTVIIVLTILLR